MADEEKTYEDGVQEGYNYAVHKVLTALGIEIKEEGEEHQDKDDDEFMKKPGE